MLEIRSLSVRFRRYRRLLRRVDIPVLDNVSLTLRRGELVALVGASGSGKSVLAQAVLGLMPLNALVSGDICVDGVCLDAAARRLLCNRALALVPQSLSYLDPMVRCGKQIAWSARRSGRSISESRGIVAASLDRYNLARAVSRAFPHELSGGMARRMLLAISTAGSADFVIADEPTSGLDAANAAAALTHLRQLADEGHAVLVITHDLAAALPMANRVVIMRDGAVDSAAPASAFEGRGGQLGSAYSRALWSALPQNNFGLA